MNVTWLNLFKNLENTTQHDVISNKLSLKVYKLTQVSDFSKEWRQVHYKVIKHKIKSQYKNNNQYCHLNIAYYNLSTAPKTLKPCSQLCQHYTRANRGRPVRVNKKRHLGDFKKKLKKNVGREAFIWVNRSILTNKKKKQNKKTVWLYWSLKWAITADFLS